MLILKPSDGFFGGFFLYILLGKQWFNFRLFGSTVYIFNRENRVQTFFSGFHSLSEILILLLYHTLPIKD